MIHPPSPSTRFSFGPALLALALAPVSAAAFEFNPWGEPSAEESASFKQLWSPFTLYRNEDGAVLNEFKLRGRYHGQFHHLDSSRGDSSGWEDRRSRFGFDAKLLDERLEARLDFQSNDGFEDAYDRLVDAYLKFKINDGASLTVGRQKPLIGYSDFLQSTNSQPTFERSQIFNQLAVDRATGVTFESQVEKFYWQTGVYNNEVNEEFGNLNGAFSFGAGVGYDFSEQTGWKKSDFRLNWLHSNYDPNDTVLTRYDDLFSATFSGQQGRGGLVVEGFTGLGARAGDVAGFYIQPTYDLIPQRLQLVGRYSFAAGDGQDSLRRQTRYESEAPNLGSGTGDLYHAAYLGLQYFIHGDKLKLLAGAEYANLDGGGNGGGFDSVTFLSGVRFSF